ncbi:steroidogenic acute regulatory protein, mitochondrial [Alosa sapidissima]|uniref:steroidogenic acute regulatory protein, mitochondrial n=1 Tax=Alosa sapidissima TaxID=34773 RepID=UPI001C09B170|nr:steroidogenic acute regulatory protein, mitochondrial [Alosa sapidissima]
MLPAVVKLSCGITYPLSRGMAGLQRTTIAAVGRKLAHHQTGIQAGHPSWWPRGLPWPCRPAAREAPRGRGERRPSLQEEEVALVQQGQEALKTALAILEDQRGWKTEISEENGLIVYSKVLPGAKRVFRLEAELDASPEELHDILFVKVEDMSSWNPSIGRIKILRQINAETMVTHEVSAETAGNLIGQRDFLSVRHCSREDSRICLAGAATQLESLPPQNGFVRAEDGPTCIILEAADSGRDRSRITWLLNMDVKGWLPKSIVNQALPRAQVDFTRYLRQRLAEASGVTAPRQERRRSVNVELGDEWRFGTAGRIGAAL